ncbi:MAG: MoaD/ThiS family protein [Deltaproteobacteria bacterium]|nr:MoaD/ThiS family protein [Deltaproteobacteria bacterium]
MGDLRAVMGKPDQRMVLPRGSTVGDLIQSLCHSYGEPFVSRVLNQSGGIEHSIVIFLNGRNIKEIGGLAATLDAGDLEIIMLPMFEGG